MDYCENQQTIKANWPTVRHTAPHYLDVTNRQSRNAQDAEPVTVRGARIGSLGGRTRRRIVSRSSPLSTLQSFQFVSDGCSGDDLQGRQDTAIIVPLPSFAESTSNYPPILKQPRHERVVLGSIDVGALSYSAIPTWSKYLSDLVYKDSLVAGVVVCVDVATRDGNRGGEQFDTSSIARLVVELASRNVETIVHCPYDRISVVEGLDFECLGGIIIDNACIRENGGRRDYFQSAKLRDVMARCSHERVKRPWFFVGFYDLWDDQPSAAVVGRAFRVAKHFGAIFEHGPRSSRHGRHNGQGAKSLSGFAFLRKEEICKLQEVWLQQKRKVHLDCVGHDSDRQVAHLPIDDLKPVIPEIDDLLASSPVTPPSPRPYSQRSSNIPTFDYVALAPPRVDFWEASPDNEPISPLGCLPLTVAASREQHDMVLATQMHLRDLKMLQPLDTVEADKIIEDLKDLQRVSAHFQLVCLLIKGLATRKINVLKGLASGFVVPDTSVEFWGVAVDSDGSRGESVDIFLSRRCPCDSATTLHVWLAHNGVSRVHRYEEELRLARGTSGRATQLLPRSVEAAIDRSTPSEILFLLQQLQVAGTQHFLRTSIEDYCSKVLLDDVSHRLWNDAHSRKYLEGTITMTQLIEFRLQSLARAGVEHLPSVESLALLHERVSSVVADALFYGDDEPLTVLSNALLRTYDPLEAWHECEAVDINADLFATIFFCVIRKAALEDVYLEATDHCPIFSQADQAAVFCELWVLGSQCELYFGMVPRALGEIIFKMHREFLRKNCQVWSPPSEKGEIMTVFAKLEASASGHHSSVKKSSLQQKVAEFGALSVFCLPAMLDIVLLTFVGRGLFMTAYMGSEYLIPACYALLISLILSAGITGWVGSVGNYYLSHVRP